VTSPMDPEDDVIAEMMKEAAYAAALGEVEPEHKKVSETGARGRKTEVPEAEPDPEADEVIDLGPYCVECRDDTTGQDKRTPASMASAKVAQGAGEDGEDVVTSVLLKGWRCENCQPFEVALMEDALTALAEATRQDPQMIRQRMREMGVETVWARWMGPMLDDMETAFGLEVE
jgi:hypothetical protein